MKNSRNNLFKNMTANVFGRVWSLISIYIFIPLYIHFLGIKLYGLVSFFATLQSAMLILNAGLTTTLRREFSVGEDTAENRQNKYRILKSIEFCYYIIATMIACLCYFGASFIARSWLNIEGLEINLVITTIRLMGISIALQLMSSLYSGGLLGLELQVQTNIFQIVWSVLKNAFVVLILWIITPDIRLFYIWFILIDFLYVIALRHYLLKALRIDGNFTWHLNNLKNLSTIWRFALGILIVSLISGLNTQIDKIIISKYLDISDLGIYNLAFSLSQLPVIFVNAIAVAIFPRFVYYHSVKEKEKLFRLFSTSYRVLSILCICIAIFVSFFSKDLLLIWTHNALIAEKAYIPTSLIVIGSMFLALQVIPYNLALSLGNTKINSFFGVINIIIIIPSMIIMVTKYGIVGAAICWLAVMLLITILYNCYIYNKFISRNFITWFSIDSINPIVFVTVICLLFNLVTKVFSLSPTLRVAFAVCSGVFTLLATFYVFDRVIYLKFKGTFTLYIKQISNKLIKQHQ